MKIHDLLNSAFQNEMKLKEHFIKVAEYHKSDSDIYYECQMLAILSDDKAGLIKEMIGKGISVEDTGSTEKSFVSYHDPGADLIEDLHYVWLLASEAEMYSMLIVHAASATGDIHLEKKGVMLRENTEKQSDWLTGRIKKAVSENIPVTG